MNTILSVLTVASQIAIAAMLILLVGSQPGTKKLKLFIDKHGTQLSFAIALTATLGSLFFSEIAHYEPCKLCWFQRIFMYPQAFLFGMALWQRRKDIFDYSLVLSVIGALIAGYHYLLQRGLTPLTPCSVVGYSASCAKVFVMNFGYITIPLMALTAFVFIIALQVVGKGVEKENIPLLDPSR